MLAPELPRSTPFWLSGRWEDETVHISSEVKISRNLAGVAFPAVLKPSERRQVAARVVEALAGTDFEALDLEQMCGLDRTILKERRMVSKEMASGQCGSRLCWVPGREDASIATNDGDHVRIRTMEAGPHLGRCVERAMEAERLLGMSLKFARDPSFGYLTTLYNESGSGMRLSQILHLPALVAASRLEPTVAWAARGAVRCGGGFGDESMGTGNLFHLHIEPRSAAAVAQSSEMLAEAVGRIVEAELEARRSARDGDILDVVARSHGTLATAVRLDMEEALALISLLALVRPLGLGPFDPDRARPLMAAVMPGHLKGAVFPEKEESDERRARADMVRSRLWDRQKLALD